MDLSSVPFFNRPMGASEKDQWIGQDEAGNNVYRMGNGSIYTVKPDADQRTTRTKIEEDVIPAAKEYLEDPSLPSAEQMKQFGVDAVQGAYESIKGAVEGTGTMGDVFGVAPAMGIASAPFEVPEGAVRSFGGKNKPQAPRFLKKEAADSADQTSFNPNSTKTIFRSPIPEVIEGLTFPKDGIKGSQLLKELQDNPSVRASEMGSVGLEVDPTKRYTKEEVFNLIDSRLFDVSVQKYNRFSDYQRQNEVGLSEVSEKDYFELTINANPRGETPGFKAKDSSHYNPNTIAHTRASIQTGIGGKNTEVILVEELQSDLLQKGFFETRRGGSLKNIVENDANIGPQTPVKLLVGSLPEEKLESFVDIVSDPTISRDDRFTKLVDFYESFESEMSGTPFQELLQKRGADKDWDQLARILNNVSFDLAMYKRETDPVRKPPIAKTEESVTLSLEALMSEGQKRGVTSLVIPPFEKIVEARFGKGTQDYNKAVQKNSGFYATYVQGLNKALKKLESEYPDEINIRGIDLKYGPSKVPSINFNEWVPDDEFGFVEIIEPFSTQPLKLGETEVLQGIEIDFTNLAEQYDLSTPRFAEGGLVQNYNQGGSVSMDEQMKLFQEGGIADDGMNRDPISGNDVPPGSLASEVRDDVDAKLSEGEYVVPADVVRYYGVAYFEKLRNKAKAGLADMEADGRIGGEPMPEGLGGENDLPFSDEELMFTEDTTIGMAEGGSVKSTFNPQAFQPGFSFGMGSGGTGSGVVTKTYRNAAGEVRSIMFVNGQPIQSIPAGFYEDTPENRAKFATPEASAPSAGVASVSTGEGPDGSGSDADGGRSGTGGSSGVRGFDVDNPLGAAQNALESNVLGNILGIAGTLSGVPGLGRLGKGFGEATSVANAAANAEVASILGYDTTSIDKAIEEASKGKLTSSMVDKARNDARDAVFSIDAPNALTQDKFQTQEAFESAMESVAPPGMTAGITSSGEFGYTAESGRGGTGQGGVTDATGTPSGFAPGSIAATGVPESVQASIAAQQSTRGSDLGGGDFGAGGFGVGTPGAAAVNAAVAEAMGGSGGGGGGTSSGGGASSGSQGTATEGYGSFGGAGGPSDGGGGGGGGGTVICTALNSLGLLPDDVYKLDQEFGRLADLHDPALTRGYRRWAIPVAEYIKKDTLLSKITRYAIKPLANAWAREMAHQMDPTNYKGNIAGKVIMAVGHPICRKLGKG